MKEKENKSAEVQIKVIIEGECITAVLKDRDVPVGDCHECQMDRLYV